ncbi:hypothetical protein ApDm4_0376 [Acetobacter pomorum]|nr:hypothetical protein ApDm4_0376 [Acetobacter pomorum]
MKKTRTRLLLTTNVGWRVFTCHAVKKPPQPYWPGGFFVPTCVRYAV